MILEIYIPNCPNEGHNETSHVVDDSGSGEKKKSLKLFLSLGFARRDESSKKIHKTILFFSIVASTQQDEVTILCLELQRMLSPKLKTI